MKTVNRYSERKIVNKRSWNNKSVILGPILGAVIASLVMFFAMREHSQEEIVKTDSKQGMVATLGAPNTCADLVLNAKFSNQQTVVKVQCLDGVVSYNRTYVLSFALNKDSRLNPDMNSVIGVEFKPPHELTPM